MHRPTTKYLSSLLHTQGVKPTESQRFARIASCILRETDISLENAVLLTVQAHRLSQLSKPEPQITREALKQETASIDVDVSAAEVENLKDIPTEGVVKEPWVTITRRHIPTR